MINLINIVSQFDNATLNEWGIFDIINDDINLEKKKLVEFQKLFNFLVMDESTALRNAQSLTFKACKVFRNTLLDQHFPPVGP